MILCTAASLIRATEKAYILLSIPTQKQADTHIPWRESVWQQHSSLLSHPTSPHLLGRERENDQKKKKKRERKREIKLERIFVRTAFSKQIPNRGNTKSAAHMVKRFQAQRNTFQLSILKPITGQLFLLSTTGGLLIRSLAKTSCCEAAGYCNLIWTRSQASRCDDTVVVTSSVKNGYLTQPSSSG